MTCKMIRKPKDPGGRSGQIVAPTGGLAHLRERVVR